MKTESQNGKHGKSIVLRKETFLGYVWMSPEMVAFREEGEGHSMYRDRKQKRCRNQQLRVWCEESGGWEYQKQSREYGRVCKAEDDHRDKMEQSWRERWRCQWPMTEISIGCFMTAGTQWQKSPLAAVWYLKFGVVSFICRAQELCVKVEVAVLGSLPLMVLMVSVGVKQHRTVVSQSSGAVRKWRWPYWAPRP